MPLVDLTGKAFDYLAAATLGILMVLSVAGVFQRYILFDPIAWMEEVNGLLVIWAICFGSAASKYHGNHLSIDILTSRLPGKMQIGIVLFSEAVTVIVMGLLCWYGIQLANQVQYKVTNILQISFKYIDYAIPAGALGVMLFSSINIVTLLIKKNR